ncbi:UNVERIFIED_CONTAM: hypothetical protein Sindi_1409600 [Sesamum indicum]
MKPDLEIEDMSSLGKDLEAVEGLKNLKGKETTVAWEVANAAGVLARLHLGSAFDSGLVDGSSKKTEDICNKKEDPSVSKTGQASGKGKSPA